MILLQEMAKCPVTFEPEYVDAEHTMFIMYTSGTTDASAPTGIKHCTAGYLLYAALSHQVCTNAKAIKRRCSAETFADQFQFSV